SVDCGALGVVGSVVGLLLHAAAASAAAIASTAKPRINGPFASSFSHGGAPGRRIRSVRLRPVFTNIPQALDRLCYRYPSMLVDSILEHEPGRRLVAVKNVTVNEEFF